ncbi:MAG: sigma-70 family RNA polymerase sigma factor [Treponema sp.]|nr:sigma-70 family RNA polymerase sigma factor [Treponema sp.]
MPLLDCERIWHEYKDRVSGYVFSHISNKEEAQDLAQSVFVKIVQAAEDYKGNPNHVSSFVYRITKNLVIDYYRTKKTHCEIPEEIKAADSVEDDYLNQMTLDYLAEALKGLPALERDVIVLHYYKSVSLKKIAVQLKSTDGKIKLAHKRAIDFLKNKFKNFLPPIGVSDGNVRRVV